MTVNGQLPDDTLRPVPGQPGARLRVDACASWIGLSADVERVHRWSPRFTSAMDAYRPLSVQERIFRQRYTTAGPTSVDARGKLWMGSRWYRLPIFASAATPGTSNHGWGLGADVTGLGGFTGVRYRQLAEVAKDHGWGNDEGRLVAEAWHWVFDPADAPAQPVTITHVARRGDDLMAFRVRTESGQVYSVCLQTGHFMGVANPEFNDVLAPYAGEIRQVGQREFDVLRNQCQIALELMTGRKSHITSDGSVTV